MRIALAAAFLALAFTPAIGLAAPSPTPAPTLPPYASSTPTSTPAPSPSAAPSATPGAISAATAEPAVPPLYVHGQVLTISGGFFVFTSGDSLRVVSGLVIPAGVTTGSYVRISIDQLGRVVTSIELEPRTSMAHRFPRRPANRRPHPSAS